MKPDKLDIDPGSANAEQQYRHWKLTFDNILDNFATLGAGDVSVPVSDVKKLAALVNYISHSVYSYILHINHKRVSSSYCQALKHFH